MYDNSTKFKARYKHAPDSVYVLEPKSKSKVLSSSQSVYDLGFDDGYIQKEVETNAQLQSSESKIHEVVQDLNNEISSNEKLREENETLWAENNELYKRLQKGFKHLNQTARAHRNTQELFGEDKINSLDDYDFKHDLLLSTKNQIETHRNEINERLARLEKEQNSSLENKIAFENQQRQLQDQLERLNSEWNQLERYKSDSLDHVNDLKYQLEIERNDFLSQKQQYEKQLNEEFDELWKLQKKLDQERNEFDIQNAHARSEIAVINDEIAYKQQKIDDSLRNLNFDLQRYEKNNELLDSEREKLQTEVKVLRQEQFDLENRKKLFEFEQQQGRMRLADLEQSLKAREQRLEKLQKEQRTRFEDFSLELKKINAKIRAANQQFKLEELERNKIRSEADAYINARKLEIATKMAELQRETQRIANERNEAKISHDEALQLKRQNEKLLEDLKNEKNRLENESRSLQLMRENTVKELNDLQNKLNKEENALTKDRRDLEHDYQLRVSEVELLKQTLQHNAQTFAQEQKLAKEKIIDAEKILDSKRKEIDNILLEANQRLSQVNSAKEWNNKKTADIERHLLQLQHMKDAIDHQKEQLIQKEKINEQEITRIQTEVANERAELERLYVVERQRQEQKDAQLHDFERNLMRQQVDFENNMKRERINLQLREQELKDAYDRLQTKEAQTQNKINQLNAELAKAQESKEDSYSLQRQLRIGLDEVRQTKLSLEHERKELDQKTQTMLADLKAYEADLKKQKTEVDSLRTVNEAANAKAWTELDEAKSSFQKSKSDFDLQKQQSIWEVTKISLELRAREQFLRNQIAILQKQKNDIELSNKATASEKHELQKQIDDVVNEKRRLENYKLQLENFRSDSINRLNAYEDELVQRRKDFENFAKEQQRSYQLQKQSLELAEKQLEKERQQFDKHKQRAIEKINAVHLKLNERENEININAAKLDEEFKHFQEVSASQKISQTEIDKQLHDLKRRQDELLNERQKIDDERSSLARQVRLYEHKLRFKEMALLSQFQKNQETAKLQVERADKLKEAVQELNKDRERFDETKKKEIKQIQQRHFELEKKTLENNLLRDELQRKFKELDAASSSTQSERDAIKKEWENLTSQQNLFKKQEFELENQRTNLMRQVQLLQADLTKRNALINTKEQQILQKTKLQKEKDQQIELALKHLETERSKFDHQKSAEISQIRDEQKSLENRQSELDKQAYKLEVQFKQLQSLKKITSADKDKFNQQLAELNRKRIQIEKRVAEVEYNRSIMLSKLRSLEGQLQLKKQQIEIDELRLKKVGNEQSNTLKEIELSLANLNQQKSEFDQTKSKELEKINSRYKEIEKSESLLNKKIYDFKANAAKLEERSQAIDVNQFKLQKQYDQFYRLKRAIVREQQKLEASKVETQKHLNKFNDELNSKRDALKSLYVKVKAVEKEQNQRKDELEKIAKDREAEMAKLETTKKEIADKFDQFKVEKENEIRRLSQIHQNLDNREKTLNKIGNKLKQEHQLIKSKSEKTQEELEQLQADKTRLIKENEILSSQQKSQFHSNHHSENHMCNYQNNNNCQNHFSSCNPCSRNNQPTYNYQQQDYGQFAQAVIPFNAYQPNPNLVPTNPLVAMQQMINQQQMQMMQQNHHWELRQLSKERNELAEKLEAIKRFRKEEKERFFMEQIRRHENEYYRRKYRHDHHDQRALVTVSQEKQRNDHAVSDMLKRLAKITTVRWKTLQEELQLLRKERQPEQKLIDDLQKKQTELSRIEERNKRFLEEAKQLIDSQRQKFEDEHLHLIELTKQDLTKSKQDLTRTKEEMSQRESQLVDLVKELRLNFEIELKKFNQEKQQLHEKLKTLSKEVKNNPKVTDQSVSIDLNRQIELMNKTREILSQERQCYAQERQALIDSINRKKAEQAEFNKHRHDTSSSHFDHPNASSSVKPASNNESKKRQIAQLNEQIAAMKAILNKK